MPLRARAAGPLLLSLVLPLALLAEAERPLVTYRVSETRRTETPRGAATRALDGTVRAAGERARFSLSSGTFPGTVASEALAEKNGLVLVDKEGRSAARLSEAEFGALFRGGPERDEAGGASVSYRDVSASVTRDGAGRPHPAGATTVFTVRLSYALRVATPGRVATIRATTKGRLETIERAKVPRSPFEDLERLVTVRGEARDALLRELAHVDGFIVFARLETEAEQSLDEFPAPGGGTPADPGPPLKSTTTVERKVTEIAAVPSTPEALAELSLGENVRVFGLERLLRDPEARR